MRKIELKWIEIIAIVVIAVAVLALASFKFLAVIGSSMQPSISDGDVLVVSSNVDTANLKVGDVISYRHVVDGRSLIFTHRIVGVDSEGFRTKGDNLDVPDNYVVRSSDVVGVVVSKIPYLGYFLHFANSLLGYITLILLPAVLIIAIELKKIRGVMRSE